MPPREWQMKIIGLSVACSIYIKAKLAVRFRIDAFRINFVGSETIVHDSHLSVGLELSNKGVRVFHDTI